MCLPSIPVGILCVGCCGGGGGGGCGYNAGGVSFFVVCTLVALVGFVNSWFGLSSGAVIGERPARRRLILESSFGCIAHDNAWEVV